MAKRRMLSKEIIDTDLFLDMPDSTQNLYYYFLLKADDDGFISSPKKIMRMLGKTDDDFKILIAKKYLIPFESGVCVIRHWKIHNYIQKDRYTPTNNIEEKALLKENKQNVYNMDTKCIQNGDTGKDRLGKDRLGKSKVNNTSDLKSRGNEIQQIFDIFYQTINPMINFGNKTNRKAVDNLIRKFGFDNVKKMTEQICEAQTKGDRFCPVATTPYQMKEKLGDYKIYFQKLTNNLSNNTTL